MTISRGCPQGRSQHFTFSRRRVLQGLASAASLCLVPRPEPVIASPNERPPAEFAIGDLVAQDWEEDDDEDAPQSATDFGEVVGLCYLPDKGSYYPRHTWVYYIYWTHTTNNHCSYPCFDGEPIAGNELRLVNHV